MQGFKEKSEFEQTVLDIRRTARVVAGGRRFSFRATVAVGDRSGRAGLGVGKGADVSGLVAGGPVRVIANLAGIKNLSAKILSRTVNKLNNARATMEALKKLK